MVNLKSPMPSDIFRQGQILNNTYEIQGVLGRGGTGEAYLAHNQISERIIAIKALNAQFSGNEDYVELMKREEQMRSILHDAVVRYTECSRSDEGHVFIVMDFVDGPSLNDVMFERRMENRELLIVAHRVLEGLTATHAQGIVHRDLSPDNIILRGGQAEKATIIDFGIAKDTTTGARTVVGNEFAGKYEYAAPEQLEGKAEFRTDLYSLGASLLAAARGDIPNVGTTPGEIFRAKNDVLDTKGIRSPLKDLIDWLTAPELSDRPVDAQEALVRLDSMLKPLEDKRTRGNRRTSKDRRNRKLPVLPLVLVGVLAVLGASFGAGILPNPLGTTLPTVSPYTLEASLDANGVAGFEGYAPEEASAQALLAAFAAVSGLTPPADSVTVAHGVPTESWPGRLADLVTLVGDLEFWSLSVTDQDATVSGLASSSGQRDRITRKLDDWAQVDGLTVTYEISAGPLALPLSDVEAVVRRLQTCGPIEVTPPGDGKPAFDLWETISLTGNTANAADVAALQNAIKPMLGDRELRTNTVPLNDELCAIRSVLPTAPSNAVSIALSKGETGETSLTGVFRTGENPVVDVQVPESTTDAYLWVMVVDRSGKVFHVLPNINLDVQRIEDLGIVENGVRRIRVLWSIPEFFEDQTRLATQVTDEDYGKSEVIAILSRRPLFDIRRPRDESVGAVAQAVQETLSGRESDVLSVASRIIDARP